MPFFASDRERDLWLWAAVVLVYLWAWARVETPEERTHLFEYGILAVLIHRALLERQARGRLAGSPALIATACAAGLGILDEAVQWLLPHRVFDWRDAGVQPLRGGRRHGGPGAGGPATEAPRRTQGPPWRLPSPRLDYRLHAHPDPGERTMPIRTTGDPGTDLTVHEVTGPADEAEAMIWLNGEESDA